MIQEWQNLLESKRELDAQLGKLQEEIKPYLIDRVAEYVLATGAQHYPTKPKQIESFYIEGDFIIIQWTEKWEDVQFGYGYFRLPLGS